MICLDAVSAAYILLFYWDYGLERINPPFQVALRNLVMPQCLSKGMGWSLLANPQTDRALKIENSSYLKGNNFILTGESKNFLILHR